MTGSADPSSNSIVYRWRSTRRAADQMNVSAAARSTGMRRRLGGGRRPVFEKSDRRNPGELRDLGGHMSLIGVACLEGSLDERRRRERLEAAEAQDAGKRLRPVADGIDHAALELARAQPELGGDGRDASVRAVERGQRRFHYGVGADGAAPLHDREQERVRILAGPQRIEQGVRMVAAEHLGGVGRGVAQLARREAEDRAGDTRAQANADDTGARCERHETGPRVRSGDRQPLARPDHVDAAIGNDALLPGAGRDLLPRAARQGRREDALGVAGHQPNHTRPPYPLRRRMRRGQLSNVSQSASPTSANTRWTCSVGRPSTSVRPLDSASCLPLISTLTPALSTNASSLKSSTTRSCASAMTSFRHSSSSGADTTSSSPDSASTTPPASSLRLIESSVATGEL